MSHNPQTAGIVTMKNLSLLSLTAAVVAADIYVACESSVQILLLYFSLLLEQHISFCQQCQFVGP